MDAARTMPPMPGTILATMQLRANRGGKASKEDEHA
jgi:hypothetical protein